MNDDLVSTRIVSLKQLDNLGTKLDNDDNYTDNNYCFTVKETQMKEFYYKINTIDEWKRCLILHGCGSWKEADWDNLFYTSIPLIRIDNGEIAGWNRLENEHDYKDRGLPCKSVYSFNDYLNAVENEL